MTRKPITSGQQRMVNQFRWVPDSSTVAPDSSKSTMDLRECVNPACYYEGQSDDKKDESCESHPEVASPSPETETDISATLPKAEFVSEVTDDGNAIGHSAVAPANPGSSKKTTTTIGSPQNTYIIPACKPTPSGTGETIVMPRNTLNTFTVPPNIPTVLTVPPNALIRRDPATRTTTVTTPGQVNNSREDSDNSCLVVFLVILILILLGFLIYLLVTCK